MNQVLPIGGPGQALTARDQADMLFRIAGVKPFYFPVPVALMDGIISIFDTLARVFPGMKVGGLWGQRAGGPQRGAGRCCWAAGVAEQRRRGARRSGDYGSLLPSWARPALPQACFLTAAAPRCACRAVLVQDSAEFGKIGRYYAVESMLVWDEAAQRYLPDATPSYGTDTLEDFFRKAVKEGLQVGAACLPARLGAGWGGGRGPLWQGRRGGGLARACALAWRPASNPLCALSCAGPRAGRPGGLWRRRGQGLSAASLYWHGTQPPPPTNPCTNLIDPITAVCHIRAFSGLPPLCVTLLCQVKGLGLAH